MLKVKRERRETKENRVGAYLEKMEEMEEMHQRAHRFCFIANSLADSVKINIVQDPAKV